MKTTKIFKGIANIAIGCVFFGIKFYNISPIVFIEELQRNVFVQESVHFSNYFTEFFKQNGLNLILAILFIGIGVLELIEIKGVMKHAD